MLRQGTIKLRTELEEITDLSRIEANKLKGFRLDSDFKGNSSGILNNLGEDGEQSQGNSFIRGSPSSLDVSLNNRERGLSP